MVTNTDKTVSTERLEAFLEIAKSGKALGLGADDACSILIELLASRTHEPAEWQVEVEASDEVKAILEVHKHLMTHTKKPYFISSRDSYRMTGPLLRAAVKLERLEREALRAASITPPAPERSKEEVPSVADAMAQLAAAIEAEKRRNAVRDEMLATVTVNLEKSEMTAEFAVLLRDYVRAERAKLSALSVKPGGRG